MVAHPRPKLATDARFRTPDDFLTVCEDHEEVLEAHKAEDWAKALHEKIGGMLDSAAKEQKEATGAMAALQKAKAERKSVARRARPLFVRFRRVVRATFGRPSREYRSLLDKRGVSAEDDVEPPAPPAPTPAQSTESRRSVPSTSPVSGTTDARFRRTGRRRPSNATSSATIGRSFRETEPWSRETEPWLGKTGLELGKNWPSFPDADREFRETAPELPETAPKVRETAPRLPETAPRLPETAPRLPETGHGSKCEQIAKRRLERVGRRVTVLLGGVGAVDDDLGSDLPVDGPVQLVLHRGEEALGSLRRYVVVDGGCVHVGDPLVELAFREPDLADALELLLEVAITQDRAAAPEALVVHREALDGELLDDVRGPLAKLDGALGIDLVADGDDGREVVVLGVVRLAVGGSCPRILDNRGVTARTTTRAPPHEPPADGADDGLGGFPACRKLGWFRTDL